MATAVRRILKLALALLGVLVLLLSVAWFTLLRATRPEPPPLEGRLVEGSLRVGDLDRHYVAYVPPRLASPPPLVLVLHASAGDGNQMRIGSIYGFDVLAELPGVARLVQVGIRDLGRAEHAAIAGSGGRVLTHFDLDWQRRRAGGEPMRVQLREVVEALPERVWVSFDIDGLDPALCPHTGTPVPGGLQFAEACLLLEELVASGRRIVGFDLDEVAPGPDGDEWDANVGARLLYKLCGFALLTR